MGNLLAVRIASTRDETRVTIYVDNQAAVKALDRPKASSGQHLVLKALRLIDESPAWISIRWITSHSGVAGNERADALAKDAARPYCRFHQ